jgi:hypothetical protein
MQPWILYGRPGCHLCEDAEEWLAELAAALGARLAVVSILDDPAIYERYKWRIPVLSAGDQLWEAPLDQQQIEQVLRR